jgi:predicted flap endonuclease-1-like 5' DNA nuclease
MDTNTLIVLGGILVALVIFFLVFGRRGRQRVELASPPAQPTVARTGNAAEGRAVTDEAAAAARDLAGEILGVEAHRLSDPPGDSDDLQVLKGVGPKLAAQLRTSGIVRYEQLAGLSANEVAMLDERMGAFRGRIARDRLVEQAQYLARGDTEGFEARFGKLGSA